MSDMLSMIQSLGDQMRWSVNLDLEPIPPSEEILVAGMGGSGIAGNYLAAASGTSTARISVHKDYSPLPGWVEAVRPLILAISYSGNTEETLDVADHARSMGLPIATITTGGELGRQSDEQGWPGVRVPSGLQPRAALGYLAGAAVRLAGASGVVGDLRRDLTESAGLADEAVAEGSNAWVAASSVSDALVGRIVIVYGGGPVSGTVAGRWKTQINENAKTPAWASLLPELDHNELVGWEAMPGSTLDRLGIVSLADRSDHPRVGLRRRLSASLTEGAVPWVGKISSWGESPLARLISLTTVGDLTSWMLARRAGIDPVPVATIEKLKQLLVED